MLNKEKHGSYSNAPYLIDDPKQISGEHIPGWLIVC